MKRIGIITLAALLCCSLFAGCRMGNGNMKPSSPTNEATTAMPTMPTVMPDTRPATEPATVAPTERETATEDTTGGTETTTEGNQARRTPNHPAAR